MTLIEAAYDIIIFCGMYDECDGTHHGCLGSQSGNLDAGDMLDDTFNALQDWLNQQVGGFGYAASQNDQLRI